MTKTNDAKLTAEQQLDVLWALMKEPGVMVGVSPATNNLVIHRINTGSDEDNFLSGTREEIIEQLCARRVAVRLQM